jgi:thiaminase/transcriptional activator TenA
MNFSADLLQSVQPQWTTMLAHPFLQQTAAGTLAPGRFEAWLRQDYVFVREEIGVIGGMLAKAPLEHHRLVGNFIPALYTELDMFEAEAQNCGISLDGIEPAPVCHAYSMFLLATAHTGSFAESFAVLYGVEKAYFDSWTRVKQQQIQPSPYQRFIDHWSGDAFAEAMQEVAQALDTLAQACGNAERTRMQELFRLTMRYEYLFWDMALTGGTWPV